MIGSIQLQLNPSESKQRDAGSESDSAGLYAHELRVIRAARLCRRTTCHQQQ